MSTTLNLRTDQLDLTSWALADPTRRAILARLAEGEATVSELSAPFSVTQRAISRHLKVLERAGPIERGRDRQSRPSRLLAQALDDAVQWIETHKRTWAERMDRVDAHLRHWTAVFGATGGDYQHQGHVQVVSARAGRLLAVR